MTTRQKRLAKLLARPAEMAVTEVVAVLLDEGWYKERQSGSHMDFAKPGRPSLTIPSKQGRMIKGFYIALIADQIEQAHEDDQQ